MNWLDFSVIAVILLSAIFAFARGFVREALSIVAWVGAAFITFKGFEWAFAMVEPMVHNQLLSQVIAGFGLFVVSLLILTILTGFVARAVRISGLTPIDRTLGFIFGLARGAFLVCLAYLLLDISVPQMDARPPWIREAKSAPYLHQGAEVLRGFLPESLKIKGIDDPIKAFAPLPSADELAKRASGALSRPTPAAPAAPASAAAAPRPEPQPSPGYRPGERREMDRLIGTQR